MFFSNNFYCLLMSKFNVKPPSFMRQGPSASYNKRRHAPHIDDFPDFILIKICSYLSLRDLASCSLVCKRWYLVSSDDLLWQKLCISIFHDKVKDYPLVGIKKHILQKGNAAVRSTLERILTTMDKKTWFPADISLKRLRCSLYLEVRNKKGELMLTTGKLLPEVLSQEDLTLSVPSKKLSLLQPVQDLGSVTLFLLVPQFPEALLSYKDSPRERIPLSEIPDWGQATREASQSTCILCGCAQQHLEDVSRAKFSNVHLCMDHLVFAQWKDEERQKDSTASTVTALSEFVYLCFMLQPHLVLEVFASILRTPSHKTEPILQIPLAESNSRKKNSSRSDRQSQEEDYWKKLENPKFPKDPSNMCDNRIFISLTNMEGHQFLFNTWRSVDYEMLACNTSQMPPNKKGDLSKPTTFPQKNAKHSKAVQLGAQLVHREKRHSHIPFEMTPCLKLPCGQFKENIQHAFVVNLLVQNNRHKMTFGLKKGCYAFPVDSDQVRYEYEGRSYQFQVKGRCSMFQAQGSPPMKRPTNYYIIQGTYIEDEQHQMLSNANATFYLIDLRLTFADQ